MEQNMTAGISDLIVTAGIVLGFGILVVVFRVQREVTMMDSYELADRNIPKTHLARADLLIIASIALATLLVILPLVGIPRPSRAWLALAAAACVAAAFLQLGYVFAILAHYDIGIKSKQSKKTIERKPVEGSEGRLVLAWFVLASVGFVIVCYFRLRSAI
jgi:hypothetical protein